LCRNCFLQRYAFGNDTVLSNGYSISVYAKGLGSVDLNKMERTWGNIFGDEDAKWEYTMGPMREKVPERDRKTYRLKYAEAQDRTLRQLYVWKGPEDHSVPDEVIELIWTR
jgi:hypothetical protein